MSRDELLARLKEIASITTHGYDGTYGYDSEAAHLDADKALIAFIGDDEIREAYDAIDKWYA